MKRRLRIITYAWGRSYVENLLDITLAAVLAPGNLPALSEAFACEFVLVTERALFGTVEAHPIYRRLAQYAAPRLLAIDDLLVAPLYGMTLTYATYRAMEDLGDAVTETDFLFFTADWIPADGSYRALIQPLERRERLIVAPSYCVVSEAVLPTLRARKDPATGVLAMGAREMAALAIPNRHNTIRGKTVNAHLFHMDIVEQFYWLVDPSTLLCHQMPIAIVCMRPERWNRTPNCFWDYGTVSELCPNATPCVLGDSDDFLMIELRSEATYDDGLRVGWPDLDTIGKKLASFVTRDHTVYGKHQMVLHARDLPPGTDEARARLKAFVAEAFTHFEGREVSYVGHPFWAFQSSLFDLARHTVAPGHPLADPLLWSACSKALTSVVNGAIDDFEDDARRDWDQLARGIPSIKDAGVERYVALRDPIFADLYRRLSGLEQATKVQEAISQRDVALAQLKIAELHELVAESSLASDYRFNKSVGLAPVFTEVPATPAAAAIDARHPMWAPLRHVIRVVEETVVGREPRILWVASDGLNRLSEFAGLGGRAHMRLASFTAANLEPGDLPWNAAFDLCVFELNAQDLRRLRRMYDNLVPALRPGAKLVAFYFHETLDAFVANARSIRSIYPRCDFGRALYAGSPASVAALRLEGRLRRLLRMAPESAPRLRAPLVKRLVERAAGAASRLEAARAPEACFMPPVPCTSLTIEIDIARG
ncbi:MAG TPA: hypothetical protein VMF53_11690 [Alphaproteobacteria bacterium]|nr:hypothetical protein [Alphaproteobacteria bacterium]